MGNISLTDRYTSFMKTFNYAERKETSPMDKLGYIPAVGTVSGTIRVVYGIAKAIFSAIMAIGSIIFLNNKNNSATNWGAAALDGVEHALRGPIEILSFLGTGYGLYKYDTLKIEENPTPVPGFGIDAALDVAAGAGNLMRKGTRDFFTYFR